MTSQLNYSSQLRSKRIKGRTNQTIASLLLLTVLLASWQFLPGLLNTPTYVIPPFSDVLAALFDTSAFPRYWENTVATMKIVFIGLGIGVGSGLLLAVILAQFPRVYSVVFPYIVAIESVPKVAIAPLFIIWFGFGMESKVVVVVLLAFFPMLVSAIHGFRGVDRDQVELFRVNGANQWQLQTRLMVPSALPQIFSGLELAVANSMIGAIVAEFVGAQQGLGVLILQAQGRMQTAAVFALLIILSALGIILNIVVRQLRKIVVFWEISRK